MDRLVYQIAPLVLLVVFSGLLALWGVLVGRPDNRLERIARRIGTVASVLSLLWLVGISLYQGQAPVLNFGQTVLFLAALVWLGQCVVQRRVNQRLFTMLPLTTVVVLILLGLALGARPHGEVRETLLGPSAAFHITLSLAGIAMLMGSGVFGAGQVILHGHIRNRRFDAWFQRLPSLDDLHRLRRMALFLGWALVTVSLVSAMIVLQLRPADAKPVMSHLHPMLLLVVLITALLAADRFRWLSSRRLAVFSVALSAAVLALLLVSVFEIFVGRLA